MSSAYPQRPCLPHPPPGLFLHLLEPPAGWVGRALGVWWETVLFLSLREALAPLQVDF